MPRIGTLTQFAVRLTTLDETDSELLSRFLESRDETAFTALVQRHGRAVLGVCRRLLNHEADAEDAFQATFLVLAKKADRLAFQDDISGWLFAVAVRVCRELLRRRCIRANRETLGPVPDRADVTCERDPEVSRIVLDEVAKLSESYRSAVVLCELEGLSRSDAAHRLGIPEGTLSSRLAAARKQLAVRLTARGLSLAALTSLVVTVPAALAVQTVAIVRNSELVSPLVLQLSELFMRTKTLPVLTTGLLSFAALAVLIGLGMADEPKPKQPIQQAAAKVIDEGRKPEQIIVTFREEVRYFSPEGKELQRIDYVIAREAEPELTTTSVVPGNLLFKIERFIPTCGRVGPNGVIPLCSDGLRLMTPGERPQCRLVDKSVPNEDSTRSVVAWRADGSKMLLQTTSMTGEIVRSEEFTSAWIDTKTGQREELPFEKSQQLLDATPDGKWYLTRRLSLSAIPFAFLGLANASQLCLVNRAGEVKELHQARTRERAYSYHRIAPDATRFAQVVELVEGERELPSALGISTRVTDTQLRTELVHHSADGVERECRQLAWSPDGKRIVSIWSSARKKGKQKWYLLICDVMGQERKPIAEIELNSDEEVRSIDWR